MAKRVRRLTRGKRKNNNSLVAGAGDPKLFRSASGARELLKRQEPRLLHRLVSARELVQLIEYRARIAEKVAGDFGGQFKVDLNLDTSANAHFEVGAEAALVDFFDSLFVSNFCIGRGIGEWTTRVSLRSIRGAGVITVISLSPTTLKGQSRSDLAHLKKKAQEMGAEMMNLGTIDGALSFALVLRMAKLN